MFDIPAGLLPFVAEGASGGTGDHGRSRRHHRLAFYDGDLVGLVRSGTLTHPGPDCVPTVYGPGAVIEEPRGQQNTHVGENLGDVPVVLDVLYLNPLGKPLSEDAPAPPCAQQ